MRERLEWLVNLIGGDKAQATVDDLTTAAAELDAHGMERKSMTAVDKAVDVPAEEEEKPDTPAPTEEVPPKEEEKDVAAQVGDKLAQQVFDAAQGDLSTITQEKLAAIIGDALRPVAEGEGEGEPTPSTEDQTMEDSNKGLSPAPADTNADAVKAFNETFATMVGDLSDMAKGLAARDEEVKTLSAQVKALTELVPQLASQMQALDALLKDRINNLPRSASAASETEIDPQSDAAKALETAAKKGVVGKTEVLGIPVKA